MDKSKSFQLKIVNIAGGILLISLAYNLLGLYKIEHYFITAATLIMLIHIWVGANFYIRYIGYIKNLFELLIDAFGMVLLLVAIFSLDKIVRWFIIFGTFFSLVMIKYLMSMPKTKDKDAKKYIATKIKAESPSIILFYFGAVLGAVLDYQWIPKFLSIAVFIAQIPFIYWLVFKKKIYQVKLSS